MDTSVSVKCVVVGDGGVGKTCMMISYTQNKFPDDYSPTVFDNYSSYVMYNNKPVPISLWDTAGQSDYDHLRPLSYTNTDIFIVCFSLVAPVSFENVDEKWIPEIQKNAKDVPILLVGTKLDLREDQAYLQKEKITPISAAQTSSLVKKFALKGYVECSAKTQKNLKNVFAEAVKIHFEPNQDNKKESGCCLIL